jgi:MFS superfamily sulfate permease-like transporter
VGVQDNQIQGGGMIGVIIAIIIVIAVIATHPVAGIVLGIIVALIIFLLYRAHKKQQIKDEQYKQFVQDTLQQHPEFGNCKLFYGVEGSVLVLSEEGHYGIFYGYNQFRNGNIYDIKTIKYVTEPYDKYTKKATNLLGKIIYRIEFSDFNIPIIDLPFGTYRDAADKAAKRSTFAEAKSTFDYIKKNSRIKNISTGSYINYDDETDGDEQGDE